MKFKIGEKRRHEHSRQGTIEHRKRRGGGGRGGGGAQRNAR